MQTAEPWHGNNFAACTRCLRRQPSCRSLFLQPEVRPVIMVIADVLVHQALQVAFIENDYVIEQIPAATANESLRHAILPGVSFAKTRYGQEKRLRSTVKRGFGLPNSPPFRVLVVDWTVVEWRERSGECIAPARRAHFSYG